MDVIRSQNIKYLVLQFVEKINFLIAIKNNYNLLKIFNYL